MILRGKFTRRRKGLLVVVLLMLAYLAYAWFAGLAITRGVEQKDMDWNADGTVTRDEILQAFYAVGISETKEGNRECRTFLWRKTGEQIRVDCRTVFKPE